MNNKRKKVISSKNNNSKNNKWRKRIIYGLGATAGVGTIAGGIAIAKKNKNKQNAIKAEPSRISNKELNSERKKLDRNILQENASKRYQKNSLKQEVINELNNVAQRKYNVRDIKDRRLRKQVGRQIGIERKKGVNTYSIMQKRFARYYNNL